MNKISGLPYQDFISDSYRYRMVTFPKLWNKTIDGNVKKFVNLSAKFLDQSRRDYVHKIVIRIAPNNDTVVSNLDMYYLDVPSTEQMFDMFVKKQYTDVPSKFAEGKSRRVFWFCLN